MKKTNKIKLKKVIIKLKKYNYIWLIKEII